jgi:3-keto-5-aminohexanoate cleavage enzyme
MKKLIIEVRVNEYAMRAGNPNVSWTAEEIGRDARAIREAGASILHFHARKPDGTPAHATEDYAAAIRAIRANSDLLVHPTLGQITLAGQEERMRHIVELSKDPALRPDIAAIDTGSTNIDVYDGRAKAFRTANKVYVNAHDTLMLFCRILRECGVKPCFSAWTSPFLRTADALLDMDLVGEPAYALLVHCEGGILGGHPANSYGLRAFRDHLPQNRQVEWTVCCKEGNLFPAAMTAIAEGGHVAIGIGDYAYPELGHPTNADLVREIVRMAQLVGRDVATPEEARQMLGM